METPRSSQADREAGEAVAPPDRVSLKVTCWFLGTLCLGAALTQILVIRALYAAVHILRQGSVAPAPIGSAGSGHMLPA